MSGFAFIVFINFYHVGGMNSDFNIIISDRIYKIFVIYLTFILSPLTFILLSTS